MVPDRDEANFSVSWRITSFCSNENGRTDAAVGLLFCVMLTYFSVFWGYWQANLVAK
jgi:hypothetical protein